MKSLNFTKELNKSQYEVVTADKGPHLVLAGAGSGKTRTLVYRVAWLISQGVDPSKILLLTFTNKAAREMMTRVSQLVGDRKISLWGGTFHSVANRLLRIYGKYLELEPDFVILDSEDQKTLLKMISKDIFTHLSEKHKPFPGLLAETISFAANSQISLADSLETKFPEWLPLLESFEKIAKEYQRRKQLSHALDFDDLLLSWKKLTKHAKVSKLLQNKWEYVLVDEYQDTNVVQAEIIFNLVKKHNNILVVGDDAQSIYSFRAANIKNILEFPDKFKKCKIHKLEINYRSTPEILNLANEIIAVNNQQFVKNLKAVKDSHVKPELVALRNSKEEAWYIADRVQTLLEAGMKPSDIAILFRAAHNSQTLEMELNKRGINYEMRGGLKFFERAHIKDVLAFLKIIGNYKDEVSWLRILRLYEGIGPITANLIYQEIIKLNNLVELKELKLSLASKAGQSWSRVHHILDILIRYKDKNIGELISLIIQEYSPALQEKYTDYKQRADDLEQLATFGVDYNDLLLFLNEISLQENFSVEEEERNQDSIVLSTVHQAKGLEWLVVFVMNMTDQSFPHPLCVKEEDKEEERRLLYVAITRAGHFLYLTYPLAVFRYDGYKELQPSPFLRGIDSRLLNYNTLSRTATYDSEDGVRYVPDPDANNFLPDVSDW